MVRWNARVTEVARTASGGFRLAFADGGMAETDVLVGADGAWSKVRSLVSDAGPVYAGLSAVELRYRDADRAYPTAAALVGDGMMFALSDARAIIGYRWPRVPGVTLVGDAAHLMSPFAGEGVNLAMIDGADLAQAILARPGDIEDAFAAYEAAMFPRAEAAAV